MGEIEEIKQEILKFRDDWNWRKYHTGKDLAMCLIIETSELLENFLWKKETEVDIEKIKDELADVFYSAFLLAAKYNLDIKKIILEKLELNKIKYLVDKAKGSNFKYNEF